MERPLLKLRQKYHLSLFDVAEKAGVDIGDVARAELGIPIPQAVAYRLRLELTRILCVPLLGSVLPILTIEECPENPTGITIHRIPGLR